MAYLSLGGDPFYNNVSLLLHMEGTNGSTTFTDNSFNPKTVTANGNAQLSTITCVFGRSSAYFDGTGDFLSVARNNEFLPVANEDFTIEAWVYLTATPGAVPALIAGLGEYGTDSDWNFQINSSLQVSFYINAIITTFTNTTTPITLNSWNHVAVSRSGTGSNNLRVFVNGIGQSFTTNSTTVGTGSRALTIGADQNGDEANLTGYIDEFRITKGVARYTGNFTVPTAFGPFPNSAPSDPNYTDVSLLLHLDSLVSSPYSDFSSFNNNNFTTAGSPTISTSVFKFGGGSVLIGGENDINYASNNSFAVAGDFTMECWVNYNSVASPAFQTIANINVFSSGLLFRLGFSPSLIVDVYINNVRYTFNISPALVTGTWYHIAISRNSGTLRAFINGVQQGSNATASGSIAAGVLKLGRSAHATSEFTNGYIDDFRFTNGVGRYTANFTPPTQAFANSIAGDPNFNNVSLLVHFEPIGGTLLDNSPSPKTAVTNNSSYNSVVSVFGPSSIVFSGTNSYIDVSYSADWNIGSFTNYTIEFWINYTTIDNNASLMGQMSTTNNPNWRLYQTAVGNKLSGIFFNHTDGSGTSTIFGWNNISEYVQPGVWAHIAIVKSSNTWNLYINGFRQGSSQTFTWTIAPTWDLTIGGVDNSTFTSSAFSIDEIRITKNVSRYSSDFVPSIAPFADYLTSVGSATIEPLQASNIANLSAINPVGSATVEPLQSSVISNVPTISPTGVKTTILYVSPPPTLLTTYGTGIYTITGTVKNGSNAPLARTVIAYNRDTNIPEDVTISNATTGAFTLRVENANCYVVCLPLLSDGVNAEVFDNITPIGPV